MLLSLVFFECGVFDPEMNTTMDTVSENVRLLRKRSIETVSDFIQSLSICQVEQ